MADFRRIIRSSENKYSNLYFLTDDETSEQIAAAFDIPEFETALVCTAGSTSGLSLSRNVLVSDQNIYLLDGKKTVVHIPLQKLYSVFISYENTRKKLFLITASGKIELYSPRLIYTDRTSFELFDLLKTLQNTQINEAPWMKESYYHTLDTISASVRSFFEKESYLSEENKSLLKGILQSDPNNLIADLVLKEDRYRSFESMPGEAGTHEEEFFSNYLDRIASDYSVNLYRVMIKAYSKLLVKDTLSLREAYLLTALGYRMNDDKTYLLYDRIQTYLTTPQKRFLLFMSAKASREKMDQCMSEILKGKIPSEVEISYTDDMGFDCLHYSIILEEKEMTSALLEAKNWGEGIPDRTVGLANSFYNYFFLAVWHFNDTIFLKEVFLHTRPEAAESLKALRRIRSLMEIASSRISLVKSRLATLQEKKQQVLHSGNPFVYSDLELASSSLLEEKSDIELEIEYLKKWKQSTDAELDRLFHKALMDTREMLEVLRSTQHPLVSYGFKYLVTPDAFISLHAQTPDSYCLLKYRGLVFIGSESPDLNSVPYTQIVGDEKNDRHRFFDTQTPPIRNPWKDYKKTEEKKSASGNRNESRTDQSEATKDSKTRWFSEAARHDSSILKKEYHLLIKRYHPDEIGNDTGLETLKEIIEEKDMILKTAL
ncbi:MAG: hypothetical protein PUF16_01410 [Lachnospiraceae bacterium]|nr:hypothetical protein [Lachnospiraceae bacterium]